MFFFLLGENRFLVREIVDDRSDYDFVFVWDMFRWCSKGIYRIVLWYIN